MGDQPRLSRDLVASLALASDGGDGLGVELPPVDTLALPEKVVQFGTGAFLRGFAEYFIDEANRRGAFNGSIVAISSTGSTRDAILNEQDGLFTLAVQGIENGSRPRQRYRIVGSLSRAISARDAWDAVLEVAREPTIEVIISNTTEVGLALDARDHVDTHPPVSFPAKLTRFLAERAAAFDYNVRWGVVVLPCELIENNGDALRAVVRQLAVRWSLDRRFLDWLDRAVVFCNTLVDRIVPGAPSRDEAERVERVFGYRDGLLTACEPYALFAIQSSDDTLHSRLGFVAGDPRIVVAPDIQPYRDRKVRLLNGGHTISVPVALLAGLETVRDAVTNQHVGRFMRRAVFEEIVPGLAVPDAEAFARDVFERFANPYINHALIDITLHATTKMRIRVVPSVIAFVERFGRAPDSLAFGFAAHLAFLRGEVQTERRAAGLHVPEDPEGDRIRAAWHGVDLRSDVSIAHFARAICADATLWGIDLTSLAGFADLVGDHLVRIRRHRIGPALDMHLAAAIPL
jgi:tagaturonate reductase